MIRIKTNDGEIFEGNTFEEVVDEMRLDMRLEQDPDIETYMQGCIHRIKVWTGKKIRFTNAEEFISELVRVGVIEILERESK